jgi:adenylosuccinate synthase
MLPEPNIIPSQLLEIVEVEYESLPGWSQDISKAKRFEDLPVNAQRYVLRYPQTRRIHQKVTSLRRIEELIGVPVRWIGVGPGRLDVIDRGADTKVGTGTH